CIKWSWRTGTRRWRIRPGRRFAISSGCCRETVSKSRLRRAIRRGAESRGSYESTSVSEADVSEVQGDPPRGRGPGHLRQSEAQAAAGIGRTVMARIAGVDLPPKKRVEVGLTYIYGIGRTRSKSLLHRAGIDFDKKVGDLSEEEVNKVRQILEEEG